MHVSLPCFLATLNWVIPVSQVQALDPPSRDLLSGTPNTPVHINDIALAKGGQLRGVVLDRQAQPTNAFRVTVIQEGRQIAMVETDKGGRFQVDGLRGGLFQVAAGQNTYMCRGWAPGTAPPAARDQLLVVPDLVVERGQRPFSDLFFADPVMVGLIIAAAVAIPIAVSRSRKDSPPGS